MNDSEISTSSDLWDLSVEQSKKVLAAFLEVGNATFSSLNIPYIELDYSAESVLKVALYVVGEIEAGRLDEQQQNIWFARLGYYFGECLRAAKPDLSWGLGNPDFAFANHPVIKGFANDEQAEVITISRNIVRSVAQGRALRTRINDTVEFWFGMPTES